MPCNAADARRASDLAGHLAELDAVLGVDTIAPDAGPRAGWTVELTCRRPTAGGAVLRALDAHGARLAAATTRGDPPHLVVTVSL